MNTCLVKTSKRIGGDNKTDLKIVELSICMNLIMIALGMGIIIVRTKDVLWATLNLSFDVMMIM